jgi:hypothetical protein
MKIGIIGSGSVGGTLGRVLARKGHDIMFGVRDPQSPKVQSVIEATEGKAKADSVAAAAAYGEVVILATPWTATQAAIAQAGNLNGKIVIDCTNPIALGLEGLSQGLVIGHTTSAAEEVAQWATGARVVKAFNNIGAENYEDITFRSQPATGFICGDDQAAKDVVATLGRDIGFEVVDVGELSKARLLEPLGMLWIHLAIFKGMGRDFAINLVKR